MGMRLPLNFSTPVGGVAAGATVTLKKYIPFKFTIKYIKIHHFVGQAGNLQCYIYIGPRGTTEDPPLWQNVENGIIYTFGDDTAIEMIDAYQSAQVGEYITVVYRNTSSNALSGFCVMVVEEK
jgi:hypothetical protein